MAESCTGTSGACPADAFQPSTTSCTGTSNGGACDGTDSCDGAGACVDGYQPSTTICRASAGQCDVAESCSGISGDCEADSFVSATTICRSSTGDCDPAESCTGTAASCPVDTGDQCGFEDTPQIVPTGTTCQQYTSGTSADLATVQYLRKGNQPITSSNPGVFFLYDGLQLTSGAIKVAETNAAPDKLWRRRLPIQGAADGKPQVILYDLSCNVVYNWSNGQTFPGVTLNLGSGTTLGSVTINGVPAGSYILSVKYNADVSGCSTGDCPNNGTTYTFSTTAGGSGSGSDSIQYVKK